MDKRELNIQFNKSGSGSLSTRIALPKKWINRLGITPEDREVIAINTDDGKVIIRKIKEDIKYYTVLESNKKREAEVFGDLLDANRRASEIYNAMNKEERADTRVYVGYANERLLSSEAFNDSGDVCDWTRFEQLDWGPGFFDSNTYNKK